MPGGDFSARLRQSGPTIRGMNEQRIRQPRPLASEPTRVIDSPYLTSHEASDYLRFANVRAFYQAVGPQRIPTLRRGRTLLFHRDHLDRWLAGERSVDIRREARRRGGIDVDKE